MVNKKINAHSNDNEKDMINLHSNLNLSNENFKNEALQLYNAISEDKIDLDSEEKNELLQELELILNHFNSSETNNIDIDSDVFSKNLIKNVNLDLMSNKNVENQISNDSQNNFNSNDAIDLIIEDLPKKSSSDSDVDYENHDKSNVLIAKDSPNKIFDDNPSSDDSFSVSDVDDESVDVGGDVSEDLSVDDALNDLIDGETSCSVREELYIQESSDDSFSVSDVDDESVDVGGDVSEDLSVDDALNDLIEDYSNEIAIKVENLSMEFKVSKDKIDTLKELFIRTVKRNKSGSRIVSALKDVSFEIPKGDRVGIIGFNGAGKSTLLKILAGVYDATEGTIETKGKIAPLLELGAGFDSNYAGKDNIFLNGAFLGYTEDFLKEKYDEILEFSELGDAINYPVKTYSSGMRGKLAFSIATIVEPDILIIDEILSVGDIKFRKKSADKIKSLINSGITVLLVSHSVGQIRDLCNKAIWIDEGKLKMYGEVNQVCDAYVKAASNATKDQLENIQLN